MLFANFGPTCVKKELAISDFSVMFVSLILPWKESCKSYFFSGFVNPLAGRLIKSRRLPRAH